jgi:hypothetical protein
MGAGASGDGGLFLLFFATVNSGPGQLSGLQALDHLSHTKNRIGKPLREALMFIIRFIVQTNNVNRLPKNKKTKRNPFRLFDEQFMEAVIGRAWLNRGDR